MPIQDRPPTRWYATNTLADQVADMYLSGATVREICTATGMTPKQLTRFCVNHGIVRERPQYRLPDFTGWSFHADNIEGLRW